MRSSTLSGSHGGRAKPGLEEVTRRDPDDLALVDHDRLTVALAFAHLKHDASCPPWIRDKALDSIDRQRAHAKSQLPEWVHLADFITKMDKMEAKLKACPHPRVNPFDAVSPRPAATAGGGPPQEAYCFFRFRTRGCVAFPDLVTMRLECSGLIGFNRVFSVSHV